MYDLLIKNGFVLDGTGHPGKKANVAIKDGKIACIADTIEDSAEIVIDAAGQVVTPGFIDSHSHSDVQFFTNPKQTEKVEQGITTAVCGQCGGSICAEDAPEFFRDGCDAPLGIHMALLIGHGSLRKAVMGLENRAPTAEELEKMKRLLADAMESGALGVSFGLTYAPGCYADTEELIEMAKVVARYGGIAAAHIRGEGPKLIDAVAEFIEVVRKSNVRGVLSHHKVCGHEYWGNVQKSLAMVDQAVREGLEIYADMYPYTASRTKLSMAFVPAAWRAEGTQALLEKLRDPENIAQMKKTYYARHPNMEWILLSGCPGCPEYIGLRMPQVAALRNQDEFSAMLDMLAMTEDQAKACFFSVCEEDVRTVMAHPRMMICTDAGVITPDTSGYHPRLRGAFPRVLGRYTGEGKVALLPEMIRKMTSLPASVYGFQTKGTLLEGMDADICVFDPERIMDHADFADPSLHATGISYVIVGGKIAAVDGYATGQLGGSLLKSR